MRSFVSSIWKHNSFVNEIGARTWDEVDLKKGPQSHMYGASVSVAASAAVQVVILFTVWAVSGFSIDGILAMIWLFAVICVIAWAVRYWMCRISHVDGQKVSLNDRAILYAYVMSGCLVAQGVLSAAVFLVMWLFFGLNLVWLGAAMICMGYVVLGLAVRYKLSRLDKNSG